MAADCIHTKTKQGKYSYIKATVNGKSVMLHRYLYEQKYGKIPPGKVLDHLCRDTQCINIDHLEIVSIAENTRRGLSAKLNYKDIKEIKLIYKVKDKTQVELARIYGVGQDQISRIVNNRRWV